MPTTRRAALLMFTALIGLPACAAGSLVDMRIVDRTQGSALLPYRSHGAEWVAGRPGNRYAVQLTNRSGGRVLVVLSVDGVNAISGETAAVGQTGYVLGPWQSAEITGWRKSYTEAAAFYFTSLADSYAARTDRPDNVGVIGAAIYRERVVRPEPRPYTSAPPIASNRADAAGASGSAEPSARASAQAAAPAEDRREREADATSAPRKAERLGTGHGEREYSPTSQVAFERASSTPTEVVRVRYDSYANLVAMGVIGSRPEPFEPRPFPGFAADPR